MGSQWGLNLGCRVCGLTRAQIVASARGLKNLLNAFLGMCRFRG